MCAAKIKQTETNLNEWEQNGNTAVEQKQYEPVATVTASSSKENEDN